MLRNRLGTYALLLAAGWCGQSALGQASWYTLGTGGFNPNIPDFYQHQNWSSTVANEWESSPGQSGWCYYASYADVFYDLTKQGYSGLLSSDVTDGTKWFNDMYDPADIPNSELSELANDTDLNKSVQAYLDATGHAATSAAPLLANQFKVNANGTVTTATLSYKNLITFLLVKARAGDEVVLKLSPGTVSPVASDKAGLWWDFHAMAMSGVDVATKTVFLSDPDTNGGSALANAGWPAVATFPGVLASKNTDPIPIPTAPKANTPASYNTFYTGFQLTNKNVVASTDSPYYNGTVVSYIDTISAPKGKLVSAAPAGGGKEETSLAINSGNDTVDKIFIEPTSEVGDITGNPALFSMTSAGSTWTDSESNTDPMGDALVDGGIEYDLSGGTGLEAGEIALMDLETDADFSLSGYTLLLHYVGDDADVWDAEVYDQALDPNDPTGLQPVVVLPEPGIALVMIIGLTSMISMRSRRAGSL
ncbi:MAG TPA: hypothetical protein VFE58_06285 [Tepidisphaeraceae bacterium]|jgi:hypothetical protein|nr:hypothetical protein [Tepidisphaeraceae bacterium]